MNFIFSAILALFVLALPAPAQTGVVNIPSNTFLVQNLGPGPGIFQIPPPGPGVTRLMVGVEVQWQHTLSSEVGPFPGQTTVGGTFSHTWDRVDYWTLTAGATPDGPITLMGDRIHPTPLFLTYSLQQGTVWDGVADWVGPTVFSVPQLVQGPQYSTTFTLNTLTFPDPDYSLWLKCKTSGTPGVSTVLGNGIPYVRIDSPWSAVVSYQYLP